MKKTIITSLFAIAIATGIQAQTETMAVNNTPVEMNGTQDDINETGVVGISGWTSFNELSSQMYKLKGANYFNTIKMIRAMEPTVMSLEATKPMWMNTEEINEDVADFKKEYMELTTEMNVDNDEFRENLEEISEQYEDLREEAMETFIDYRKTVMDGNKEYKEEIEKNRSKMMNGKDGQEEYKEETKNLKKIRDGKTNQ